MESDINISRKLKKAEGTGCQEILLYKSSYKWWISEDSSFSLKGGIQMSSLHIFIDSSVRGTRTSKYGKAAASWFAVWDESGGRPCRAGLVYSNHQGPNKIFYEGIIQALNTCYDLVSKHVEVKVFGDCDPVLKQLNKERNVNEMQKLYDRVREIESSYQGPISYKYMNEENSVYKVVDECSKIFRHNISQTFDELLLKKAEEHLS